MSQGPINRPLRGWDTLVNLFISIIASRVGSMYRTAARTQGAINRAPIHINLRVQMSPAPPQGTRKGHPYHTTKRPTRPVYGRGGLAPTLRESGVNPRQRLKLMCMGCDKSGPTPLGLRPARP